jgi:hypothetical protein
MVMLLTFVLFGAVLPGIIGEAHIVPALVLGLIVIFAIRPPFSARYYLAPV